MTRIGTVLMLMALCAGTAEAQLQAMIHAPKLPKSKFYVPRGTVVEIALKDPVDTAASRPGETFRYTLHKAITDGGRVVVPAGAVGEGKILKVRGAAAGRTARLHLDFGEVMTVEDRPLKLGFTWPAPRHNQGLQGRIHARLGGYFEDTQRVSFPAGAVLRVVTEYPYGMRIVRPGPDGRIRFHRFDPGRDK